MPEQSAAPSFETLAGSAPSEPDHQVADLEALALGTTPPVDMGMSADTAQEPTTRSPVDKVRRVVLVGDGAVLTSFFVTGITFELWVVAASALIMLVLLVGRGMTLKGTPSALAMVPIAKAWTVVFAPACAVVALSGSAGTGRELVLGAVAMLAALLMLRAVLRTRRVQRLLGLATGRRSLLVGDEESLLPMIAARDEWPGCEDVVGILVQGGQPPDDSDEDGHGLSVERVAQAAHSHHVDQVTVVPGGGLGAEKLRELSWALEGSGVDLVVTTELQGVAPHRVEVTQVGGRLLMRVGSTTPRGWTAVVKGILDRVGAVLLLVLLTPLWLGLVLAIRLSSPGAAVFRQLRVGKGGAEFTMYKFRTMHQDAEAMMSALSALNDHGETAILFKMRNDPRVTRLGRMLRRTSLDEFPQLINVLKGDMSLIGPRPALPAQVARYDKQALRRLAVKPGMTGLWQVSGRSTLSWQESLRYDLDYVDNWSPGRETAIALKTVKAVISNDGAY